MLFVAAGGWFAVRSGPTPEEFRYGGITCSELQQVIPQYLAGDLDQKLIDQIESHLAACAHCRDKLRQMRAKEPAVEAAMRDPLKPDDSLTTTLASADF